MIGTHTVVYQDPATNKGLPQGLVLNQIRLCLFNIDIFTGVESENLKFADDGRIWRTGADIKALIQGLERDLKKFVKWTKKWRMKINIDKTEFCVFSR